MADERLNDSPLSAVHDPWVPVSEDYMVCCQTFPWDAKLLKQHPSLLDAPLLTQMLTGLWIRLTEVTVHSCLTGDR
jgi:hypothetical protein